MNWEAEMEPKYPALKGLTKKGEETLRCVTELCEDAFLSNL